MDSWECGAPWDWSPSAVHQRTLHLTGVPQVRPPTRFARGDGASVEAFKRAPGPARAYSEGSTGTFSASRMVPHLALLSFAVD
jgi:hypothetical protein